ncbi:MAG: FKBP-type peptidyl-prolyl cis-trans isomerase [Pseudobacter sp.]|uniref:FKBP-type peptidyl-prolyl cis-trans isomerase n=1 Tax=Pseudobacter sp. TaxID=2045420 RepID=UPI003F8133FE
MRKTALICCTILLIFSHCFKKENDCAPRNIVAPASEVKAVKDYLGSASVVATEHSSGLFYQVLSEGMGIAPQICSSIRVRFSGKLVNGTEFESSQDVVLNLKLMLESWRLALPMIKPGGRIRFYVPPTLGYGADGKKDKNTNAVLVAPYTPVIIYEVTLLEVS